MRTAVALAAAALLAAPALAAPPANPFDARLRGLSPADRAGALRRAVTLDGQRCGRLSASIERGAYRNLGFWQVHCAPGGDYGVFVGPGGEVQVRSCADLRSLKLPACIGVKPDPVRR